MDRSSASIKRTSARRWDAPETKYEEDGGPSLGESPASWSRCSAGFARAPAPGRHVERADRQRGRARQELLAAPPRLGALTLTPLYDLMCTLHYGDDRWRCTSTTSIERTASRRADRQRGRAMGHPPRACDRDIEAFSQRRLPRSPRRARRPKAYPRRWSHGRAPAKAAAVGRLTRVGTGDNTRNLLDHGRARDIARVSRTTASSHCQPRSGW